MGIRENNWYCEGQDGKVVCETDHTRVELSDKGIKIESIDGEEGILISEGDVVIGKQVRI